MIRQAKHVGAGRSCALVRAIGGCIIDHQNWGFPHHTSDFLDDAGDGPHLIEGRDQNQKLIGSSGRLHSAAT